MQLMMMVVVVVVVAVVGGGGDVDADVDVVVIVIVACHPLAIPRTGSTMSLTACIGCNRMPRRRQRGCGR